MGVCGGEQYIPHWLLKGKNRAVGDGVIFYQPRVKGAFEIIAYDRTITHAFQI
jgi:hypothetical protein